MTETQPLLTGDDRIVLPRIVVPGTPIGKGSMKCVGQRGPKKHVLVDDKQKLLEPWQDKIAATARQLLARYGQILRPLSIRATITVARPKSITLAMRQWPTSRGDGDKDKYERAINDALERSGLIKNDAQVVHSDIWKAYPDTPDCPDRLDEPGVVIRIEVLP